MVAIPSIILVIIGKRYIHFQMEVYFSLISVFVFKLKKHVIIFLLIEIFVLDCLLYKIELLEEKLNTINDLSIISVTVATELNGAYLNIPFSTIELLIDYLKNFKKVRK